MQCTWTSVVCMYEYEGNRLRQLLLAGRLLVSQAKGEVCFLHFLFRGGRNFYSWSLPYAGQFMMV